MKKLFLSALMLLLVLTSCKEKTKNELIEDAFMNYAEVNFGEPDNVLEITSIEAKDTISKRMVMPTLDKLHDLRSIMTDNESQQMYEYTERFKKDKTFIVFYTLKVRLLENDQKVVKEYYACDNGKEIKFSEYPFTTDEIPELYKAFSAYLDILLENIAY